jgi:hypothetical protein
MSNELVPSPAPEDAAATDGTLASADIRQEPRASGTGVVGVPEASPAGAAESAIGAASLGDALGLLVQGFVEDESGKPVSSALVYVASMDAAVLTEPDGQYALRLASEPDSFEITVERIGFRQQTRSITPSEGDFVAADFRLREEALALDEIVVTGESEGASPRSIVTNFRARPFSWRPAPSIAAEGYVGSDLWTLPERDVLTIDVAYGDNANETHVARVRQDLGNGVTLTLVQGRTDDRRTRWPIPSAGAVLSTWRGEMLITATAPISEDSLRALLTQLR